MTPAPTRVTRQQITELTIVTGEIATSGTTAGTWLTGNPPAQSLAVYVNGLRQLPQSYTVAGNVLTSPYWQPTDSVMTDYEY